MDTVVNLSTMTEQQRIIHMRSFVFWFSPEDNSFFVELLNLVNHIASGGIMAGTDNDAKQLYEQTSDRFKAAFPITDQLKEFTYFWGCFRTCKKENCFLEVIDREINPENQKLMGVRIDPHQTDYSVINKLYNMSVGHILPRGYRWVVENNYRHTVDDGTVSRTPLQIEVDKVYRDRWGTLVWIVSDIRPGELGYEIGYRFRDHLGLACQPDGSIPDFIVKRNRWPDAISLVEEVTDPELIESVKQQRSVGVRNFGAFAIFSDND